MTIECGTCICIFRMTNVPLCTEMISLPIENLVLYRLLCQINLLIHIKENKFSINWTPGFYYFMNRSGFRYALNFISTRKAV